MPDMPAEEQNGRFLSTAGLRARGWSPGMVRRLLGPADSRRPNPHFPTAPQIRLYRWERVVTAERSAEFRTAAGDAARRSAAARAAALRRRKEVLARIAAEPIEVPRMAPARLAALAAEHHAGWGGHGGPGGAATTPPDSPAPLEGWPSDTPTATARHQVDYLLHHLTRYDELLRGLRGSTGRSAAAALLARRVYAAISEAYPHLARECERRMPAPGVGPSCG